MALKKEDVFDYEIEVSEKAPRCSHDFYLESDAYYVCHRCGEVAFVATATTEELWMAFKIAIAYHTNPESSITLLLPDPPIWFKEFQLGEKK